MDSTLSIKLKVCSKQMKVINRNRNSNSNSKKTPPPFLSFDIMFNILSWVSAEILHKVVRLVSKSWASCIISTPQFFNTHLSRNSTLGFFLEPKYKGKLSLHCQQWPFKQIPVSSIRDSVDGLLLCFISSRLHLINPLTKQHLILPHYNPTNYPALLFTANIARISRTQQVKIICNYAISPRWYTRCCGILTIGTDNMSWEILDTCTFAHAKYNSSFSAGSIVIYWHDVDFYSDQIFWAIDLDDESIHSFRFPPNRHGNRQLTVFLPMGRNLYVLSICLLGHSSQEYEVVIWKLKAFHRCDCEWVEVYRSEYVDFIPPGLVFVPSDYIFVENEKLIYSFTDVKHQTLYFINDLEMTRSRPLVMFRAHYKGNLTFYKHICSLVSF